MNTVEAYFEPILDIKLDSEVKFKMLECAVDKFGYIDNKKCQKITIDGETAYYIWKNEKAIVFTENPIFSRDYETYPRYEW